MATAIGTSTKDSTKQWLCQNSDATCWDKLHHFYIPKGLFGPNPTARFNEQGLPKTVGVRTVSKLYRAKMKWRVEVGALQKEPSVGGRKKKERSEEKSTKKSEDKQPKKVKEKEKSKA